MHAPAGLLISLIPHTLTEAVPRARDTDEQGLTPWPSALAATQDGSQSPTGRKTAPTAQPHPQRLGASGWDQAPTASCRSPADLILTPRGPRISHYLTEDTKTQLTAVVGHRTAVAPRGLCLRWRASGGEDEGQGRLRQHRDANIFRNSQ